MLLYHFTEAEYALDNVEKKRIKIAQLHKLNDPYELSAVCAEPPYGVKNRDALVNMFKENIGIICFSEKYNCPIMWGHYADSHTGICLVFEVSGKFKNSSLLKVKYCKNLLKVCIDQEGRLVEAEKLAKKLFPINIRDGNMRKNIGFLFLWRVRFLKMVTTFMTLQMNFA